MGKNISDYLESLIAISGEDNSVAFEDELNIVNSNISKIKMELNNLEVLMASSSRYYDETAVNLDKNSIMAAKKKITKLEGDNVLISADVINLKNEADDLLESLVEAKGNAENFEELIKNISYKLVGNNPKMDYYNKLTEKSAVKFDYWFNLYKDYEKKRENKLTQIELLNANRDNNLVRINDSKKIIEDLENTLKNDLNYVNSTLKEKDLLKKDKLNQDIINLEIQFDVLNGSVRALANELSELIFEGRLIYAYKKLDELIRKIELVPYVKENNYNALENDLMFLQREERILREKIKNDEFLNDNNKILHKRLKDLNRFLENNRLEIIDVRKKINNLDKNIVVSVASKIDEELLDENLIADYNRDLNHVIEYSVILKNTSLKYLEQYKKKLNTEINDISKKIFDKVDLIDDAKKEEAIMYHKNLLRDITNIKNRLNKKVDIYNIKAQIEVILGSMKVDYMELENAEVFDFVPNKPNIKDLYPGLKFLKVVKILNMK